MFLDHRGQVENASDAFGLNSESGITSWHPQAASLVSLERLYSVSRKQFILGVVLGALLSQAATIPIFMIFDSRRTTATVGAIVPQDVTSNSKLELNNPASSPEVTLNPPTGIPKQRSQNSARPNAPAQKSSENDFVAVPSQPPVVISTSQRSFWKVSPQPRTAEVKAEGNIKPAETLEELWSSVRVGNIHATIALADRYARGDGVAANCTQARILLLTASKKGSAEAAQKLQQLDSSCPATNDQ
jgi:hypothetical protein